jgi:hypothetical protein
MKIENRILNAIAAISPWLAPLIPTYYAAYNAYDYLAKGHEWYDVGLIVAMALTVEFIGLAGVHTAIQLWNYNRTKNASDDPAPLWLAILAVAFYMAIIITVNAALDYARVASPSSLPYVKILAVSLLSLLALNSALIVALRAGQNDREERAEKRKTERKEQRAERKANKGEQDANNSRTFAGLSESDKLFVINSDSKSAAVELGVTPRAIQKWRKRIHDEIKQGEG